MSPTDVCEDKFLAISHFQISLWCLAELPCFTKPLLFFINDILDGIRGGSISGLEVYLESILADDDGILAKIKRFLLKLTILNLLQCKHAMSVNAKSMELWRKYKYDHLVLSLIYLITGTNNCRFISQPKHSFVTMYEEIKL